MKQSDPLPGTREMEFRELMATKNQASSLLAQLVTDTKAVPQTARLEARRMIDEVVAKVSPQTYIRRYPLTALLAAGLVGFAVGSPFARGAMAAGAFAGAASRARAKHRNGSTNGFQDGWNRVLSSSNNYLRGQVDPRAIGVAIAGMALSTALDYSRKWLAAQLEHPERSASSVVSHAQPDETEMPEIYSSTAYGDGAPTSSAIKSY